MTRRKTTSEFIEQANSVHGSKYDYSVVQYKNTHSRVEIICKFHGSFFQIAKDHLNGFGCASCSGRKRSNNTEFAKKSVKIHGSKYDYSSVDYKNNTTAVDIKCLSCKKSFRQRPQHHLKGHGCPSCSNVEYHDESSFTRKAKKIHGNRYDYSDIKYKNNKTHVSIKCRHHGNFLVRPDSHLRGSGCRMCSHLSSIKEEAWLKSLNIKELKKQYKIGRYRVDGYDPNTNTVYEFLGDYWHGNLERYNPEFLNKVCGKTMLELNAKTQKRLNELKEKGYTVHSIWESDYDAAEVL